MIVLLYGGAGKDSWGKGSQVYRTMLLRDCGDEVNEKVTLQNPHKPTPSPKPAPTDRQARDP